MRRFLMNRSAPASRRALLGMGLAGLSALLPGPASPGHAAGRDERPASSRGDGGARGGEPPLEEGVAGRLTDRRGAPISGALIAPSAVGGAAGPIPEIAVQTDRDGRFQWSLGPGRYRLDAVSEGRTVASREVAVSRRRVTRVRMTAGRK